MLQIGDFAFRTANYLFDSMEIQSVSIRVWLASIPWLELGIKGLGLVIALFVARPVIFSFLRLAKVPHPSLTATEEAVGRMIGYIERFLAFSFVLDGADNAIAMLIAAKGVYKLHELGVGERSEKENEDNGQLTSKERPADNKTYYIMIGTFTSIAFAISVAFSIRFIVVFLRL